MLMMEPPPFLAMRGTAALLGRYTLLRLVLTMRKKSSEGPFTHVQVGLDVGGAEVVHQNVQPALLGRHLVHHAGKALLPGGVKEDHPGPPAGGNQLVGDLLSGLQAADPEIDRGPLGGQRLGAGQADAAGGGGDQSDLVFEFFHAYSPFQTD